MSIIGTRTYGLRTPLIHDGDNLNGIIVDTFKKLSVHNAFTRTIKNIFGLETLRLNDRDILCITESIVARSQKNYITTEQIQSDIRSKIQGDHLGIVFPILSRNRFAEILRSIAPVFKQITIQLSWPADEVGNRLGVQRMLGSRLAETSADKVFNENEFRNFFGISEHECTGIDYIELYKSLGSNIRIIFSNNPQAILSYTDEVLAADIHTRAETKQELKEGGAKTVIGLDDIATESINGSGYNPEYGLLGSNLANEGRLKLFPRNGFEFVQEVQHDIIELTGKIIEVLIFGDGAFKCPVSGIWELADPVVSPGYTDGLKGTPNEIKMKYQIDKMVAAGKSRKEIEQDIDGMLRSLNITSQLGTTPRQIPDLVGSWADLNSGSGGRGVPLVLIQGYFKNYSHQRAA